MFGSILKKRNSGGICKRLKAQGSRLKARGKRQQDKTLGLKGQGSRLKDKGNR